MTADPRPGAAFRAHLLGLGMAVAMTVGVGGIMMGLVRLALLAADAVSQAPG